MPFNNIISEVTERIEKRSEKTRQSYLKSMQSAAEEGPRRAHLTCGNQAHAYAAMGTDKARLVAARTPNIGIVTAYNDMLSAHQPFERFPDLIKKSCKTSGRYRTGRRGRAGDV